MATFRRLLCTLLLIAGCSLSAPSPARSEPLPLDPVGARHMGLGGASAALGTGADAVYHNPASLVWQTITAGAGLHPVGISEWPEAWWVWFYNRETEYGWPLSFILQGWEVPSGGDDGDDLHLHMVGMPIALNFTQATPGAVTLKVAFERREDGRWVVQAPLDLGFLARHPSGATLGLVWRNQTIGSDPYQGLERRLDYGIAWGGGPLTVTAATSWAAEDNPLEDAGERYRVGVEAGSPQVQVRGGYMRREGEWRITGGLSLASAGTMAYKLEYAATWNPREHSFRHFVQYILVVP